jgi:hypothetical protein
MRSKGDYKIWEDKNLEEVNVVYINIGVFIWRKSTKYMFILSIIELRFEMGWFEIKV